MSLHQRRSSPLAAWFAAAIGVLIVYACLHPFTGWRDPGLPLLDFLTAPWPRYYSQTDLIVNVLGFVPFSFALVPALGGRLRPGWAVFAAVTIAGLLSLGLETLQNFLPSRVPSNVDLGCNTLGVLLGALAGARWGAPLFDARGTLARWRTRRWSVTSRSVSPRWRPSGSRRICSIAACGSIGFRIWVTPSQPAPKSLGSNRIRPSPESRAPGWPHCG